MISQALVLPDRDFDQWLDAVRPYLVAFEGITVVRNPAGDDLNRFRNVSAVQAYGVWYDDNALEHIRRSYLMVVRVDVIDAQTPEQLAALLQTRIDDGDRYGEQQNTPPHLFDRFILRWPGTSRPPRIPQSYEGMDIGSEPGETILAGASGVVTEIAGAYLQITTIHEKRYVITYLGLRDISVRLNQHVSVGDAIGIAAGSSLKLIAQVDTYFVDPVAMIYWQGLRVRPTVDSLRVRSLPGLHGDIVGIVNPSALLETDEMHGRTLAKVGVENEWLKVRYPDSERAYCAAQYLKVSEPHPITGMNLDIDHPLGTPDVAVLGSVGWVRMLFNVSLNPNYPHGDSRRYGNTDVDFAFSRYAPTIERYANAGFQVILVVNHQTYGEGQGYVWETMDQSKWQSLTTHFTDILRQIVVKFGPLVSVYQIWNEQDTPIEQARAAVPMPIGDYAHLLSESIKVIRGVGSEAQIITGGHVTGPGIGAHYARNVLVAMGDVQPDGIAFHPYGRGPVGNRFSYNGAITESVHEYGQLGLPLWITEWGVLDRQHDNSLADQVAEYAHRFLIEVEGKVACACWYAWAEGMDNGYGLVSASGQPRQPLYDVFTKRGE